MTLRQQYAMAVLPVCLEKWYTLNDKQRQDIPYTQMAFDAADAMLEHEGFEVEALQDLLAALGPITESALGMGDHFALSATKEQFEDLKKAYAVVKGVK